jgi:hypothetical protein
MEHRRVTTRRIVFTALAALAVVAVFAFPAVLTSAAPGNPAPVARAALGINTVPDTIRVLMPDNSVATMDMDEYLKGVVPAEVDASWPMDALEAQAVAARCYASTAHRHPEAGADVCTTTHCQAWSAAHDPRTDLAVEATHKVAALYNGEIIEAYYFGHCDGHTRNSEDVWGGYIPYCRSVSCPCGNTTMYGHGVGMCQEGASVLAAAGWDYRDILEHYYAGITVESTESAALDWHFAEGTTRPGFVTYLCIANPSDTPADVSISYMVEGGGNKDAAYAVPPHSRTTVEASRDIGSGKDFSCRVTSTNGVGIVAERPMYFAYDGKWTGGHDAMGAQYPRTDWYFAEGTTRTGFVTYLCLENPSDSPAEITVSYMMDNGEVKNAGYSVQPRSRKTIDTSMDTGPGRDFSCRVSTTNGVGIVAERPMYFAYGGKWTGGHDTMGAPYPKTDWYFAEGTTRAGFVSYVCIGNPSGAAADVTVTYLDTAGGQKAASHSVAPHSRTTIDASSDIGAGKDFSLRVSSTNGIGIVAERPMYFDYGGAWTGGHDTMGAPYPKTDWYFAEGTSRPGFVTYLCLQNASDKTADVKITYIKGDGTTEDQAVQVPAGARTTVSANDFLGSADDPGHDFAIRVRAVNNAALVAERPMYFNFRGEWSGGHDAMGH